MEGDGRAQKAAGSGDFQPRPLPRIRQPSADDQAAEHVHGPRPEAPEKDKGKTAGSVLDQIAHIFKGGEGKRRCDRGGLDPLCLRLEYQQVKHQRQQLHHLLHHRGDLHGGGKRVRLIHRRKEGIDVGRKQAHPHPGNAEQEEAELPPAHTQGGHQQRGYHADEDVFDVGHASTAVLVAGSSPDMARVSSISHQKVGLAGEALGQKQPVVQSRYSANTKHSTPMWKYRIFRAGSVCPLA